VLEYLSNANFLYSGLRRVDDMNATAIFHVNVVCRMISASATGLWWLSYFLRCWNKPMSKVYFNRSIVASTCFFCVQCHFMLASILLNNLAWFGQVGNAWFDTSLDIAGVI